MEFQITQSVGRITCNFDELKKELSEKMSVYDNVIVSEDAIKVAKSDLANLRKVKTEIDNKRKEAKKIFNQPYDAFEKQVKELIALVDAPINAIDKQIKAFDETRKAEKEKHCRELFDANVGDLAECITYESVFRDAWLNASTKDTEIISDISGARVKVRADLDAIEALSSEFEGEIVKAYKESGNQLSVAIQRNTQLISAKQMAEKRIAEEQAKKEEPPIVETVNEEPKKYYATYTVRAKTEDESENLRQMLEFNNYEFSLIY